MNFLPALSILSIFIKPDLNPKELTQLRQLLNFPIDWPTVSKIASRHGVSALLYYNLKKQGLQDYLPSEVWRKLKETYYKNIAHNLLVYQELSKILRASQEAGIELIVRKGAALAELVYPNMGLRPFGDIDLVVRRSEFLKVEPLLRDLGYRPQQAPGELFRREFLLTGIYHKEIAPNLLLQLDVHSYLPFQGHRTDEIWERAKLAKIAQTKALVMSPEDTILDLAIHLSIEDAWARLIWLYDLRQVIHRYGDEIDWTDIVKKVKESKSQIPIGYTLNYLSRHLGTSVPEEVLQDLHLEKASYIQGKFYQAIFSEKSLLGAKYISPFLRLSRTGDRAKLFFAYCIRYLKFLARRYASYKSSTLHPYLGFKKFRSCRLFEMSYWLIYGLVYLFNQTKAWLNLFLWRDESDMPKKTRTLKIFGRPNSQDGGQKWKKELVA